MIRFLSHSAGLQEACLLLVELASLLELAMALLGDNCSEKAL